MKFISISVPQNFGTTWFGKFEYCVVLPDKESSHGRFPGLHSSLQGRSGPAEPYRLDPGGLGEEFLRQCIYFVIVI